MNQNCYRLLLSIEGKFNYSTRFFYFLYYRLNQIYAKFDEVKHSGGMLATADFGEYMKISNYGQTGYWCLAHFIFTSI